MKRLILVGAFALLVAGPIGCEAMKNFWTGASQSAAAQAKDKPPTNYVDLITIGVNAIIAGISYAAGAGTNQAVHVIKRRRAAKKAEA